MIFLCVVRPSFYLDDANQPRFWPGVARVIITAKQGLGEGYAEVLRRLVAILRVIARNPSNPSFDQYIFEGISGLILRV